jgi:hypothetical protein
MVDQVKDVLRQGHEDSSESHAVDQRHEAEEPAMDTKQDDPVSSEQEDTLMNIDESVVHEEDDASKSEPPAKRMTMSSKANVMTLRCTCGKATFQEVAEGRHRLGKNHGVRCGCGTTFRVTKEFLQHVKSCDHIIHPQ